MSDLTLQEALAEVGKYGRLLKGFEKITEVARALEGAEQLLAERQSQCRQEQARLDGLQADVERAVAAIEAAQSEATPIVPAAEAQAAALITAAEDQARAVRTAAAAAVALAKGELASAQDALAEARAALAAVQAEHAETQAKIAAALDAARQRFEA